MNMTVVCEGCGKSFAVGPQLYGKKARCKQCGAIFRVPDPTAATSAKAPSTAPKAASAQPKVAVQSKPTNPSRTVAQPKPAAAARPPAQPQRRAAPPPAKRKVEFDEDDAMYALAAMEQSAVLDQNQPAVAMPASVETSEAPRSRVPAAALNYAGPTSAYGRPNRSAAADQQIATSNALFLAQVIAFCAALLLTLLSKAIPSLAMLAIPLAAMVGITFVLWGNIACLMVAARHGAVHVLGFLIVPCYALIFILMHLDETGKHFLRSIAGFAIIFAVAMCIPAH